MKAKIFISCGQNKSNENEVNIANEIGKLATEYGFEPYLAILKQDSKSFRENIFRELSESEYFLFIDIKRESLLSSNDHRGSLFCHQELAIASFLDIESAYFQNKDVKREGLLNYIQSNPVHFDETKDLMGKVRDHFESKKWDSEWKNKLSLSIVPDTPSIATVTGNRRLKSIWYHVLVHNLHKSNHAKNCYAFLESFLNKKSGQLTHPKTVELHWAGYDFPGATILPQSNRALDALTLLEEMPNLLIVYSYSTSSRFHPAILPPGEYELTYRIVSDNFPEIRKTFYVHYKGGLENSIDFRAI